MFECEQLGLMKQKVNLHSLAPLLLKQEPISGLFSGPNIIKGEKKTDVNRIKIRAHINRSMDIGSLRYEVSRDKGEVPYEPFGVTTIIWVFNL